MRSLDITAGVLLVIGGVNWGIVGATGSDLVGALLGDLSPASRAVYLLVGLAEVEFGDHQRYTLLWALSAAVVMLVATVAFGVIPVVGNMG